MPKRERVQSDEEDYDGEVAINTQRTEDGLKTAVNQIIRIVLSKDMKNQYFRREHVPAEVKVRSFGFAKLIEKVDLELQQVYGLRLVSVVTKKKKVQYMLTSDLDDKKRAILGELWNNTLENNFNADLMSFTQYFLPQLKPSQLPGNNSELVKSGILFLILSLIIIAENYITEVELFDILQTFGISKNQNVRNSNYGLNLLELVNEFIKRDYLLLQIAKGSVESENVASYSLGTRATAELQPQDVYNYIKLVWGEKFDENEARKVLETIKRVYEVELINEFDEVEEEELQS